MKINIKHIFLLLPILVLLSCTKDERLLFDESPAIYFYKAVRSPQDNPDAFDYSFATHADAVKTDTMYLWLRIIGKAEARPRTVNIEQESGSAKAGYHYKIGAAVVPAGAYDVHVPVYLYRKAGLRDSVVTAMFVLKESADFKLGFPDNPKTDYGYDRLHYKLSITDQLLKPTNWDSLWLGLFGPFSDKKFRFLIQATGLTDWNATPSFSYRRFLVQTAKLALLEYQQQNGPMLDENGVEIFIP